MKKADLSAVWQDHEKNAGEKLILPLKFCVMLNFGGFSSP